MTNLSNTQCSVVQLQLYKSNISTRLESAHSPSENEDASQTPITSLHVSRELLQLIAKMLAKNVLAFSCGVQKHHVSSPE